MNLHQLVGGNNFNSAEQDNGHLRLIYTLTKSNKFNDFLITTNPTAVEIVTNNATVATNTELMNFIGNLLIKYSIFST